jgi:hypothetical protein
MTVTSLVKIVADAIVQPCTLGQVYERSSDGWVVQMLDGASGVCYFGPWSRSLNALNGLRVASGLEIVHRRVGLTALDKLRKIASGELNRIEVVIVSEMTSEVPELPGHVRPMESEVRQVRISIWISRRDRSTCKILWVVPTDRTLELVILPSSVSLHSY